MTCKILYEHSTPSVDRDTSDHGHHSDSGSSVWMFFTVSILLYTCIKKVPGPLETGDREWSTQKSEKELGLTHICFHHNEWNVNLSYLV